MLDNHNTILQNTPVIFCGVNCFEDDMIKDAKDFTGVVEAYDLKSTIEIALK